MLNEVKSSKAGKIKKKIEEPGESTELGSTEPKIEQNETPVVIAAGTKKTLILIGGLALVTLILLILALAPSFKFDLKTTLKPAAIASPAHTTLVLNKPVATATVWNSDIAISTGSNKVAAVELDILYNPQILTNVDIKPGSFFKDPAIVLKTIDTKAGIIKYVIGAGLGQKPISGKGTLATISFTKVTGANQQTALTFLPETAVSASGEVISVLKASTNVIFTLASPTPTK